MAARTWGKESVVEFVGFCVSFAHVGAELSGGFFVVFLFYLPSRELCSSWLLFW